MTAAGKNAISKLRANSSSVRSPASVPRISRHRRSRKIHITASIEPNWITTSNTLSLLETKFIQSPRISRCAVLDMGKNSVRPSTTPRIAAFNKNSVDSVILLLIQITALDAHGGDAATCNFQHGKCQDHTILLKLTTVTRLRKVVKAIQQVAGKGRIIFFIVDQPVHMEQQFQVMQISRAVHAPAVFGLLDDVQRFVLVGKLARNGFKHIDGRDQPFDGSEFVGYQHQLAAGPAQRFHQLEHVDGFMDDDGLAQARRSYAP